MELCQTGQIVTVLWKWGFWKALNPFYSFSSNLAVVFHRDCSAEPIGSQCH